MRPESEADVVDAVQTAKGPLSVRGGHTRGFTVAGEALSTSGLSGIELYEPGALTIVAKAGTPVAEIEAALAAEGQHLPFEPMDHRALLGTSGTPTIGGVVAANVSGPRRVQAGACRDSLIGVCFVTGEGTAIANGGRVMKNVTGYDLVKLMAGSHGTLGILTQVSFKVLPRPDSQAMLLLSGQTTDRAVVTMSKALGSPYDVTGAAFAPSGPEGHPVTLIRLEGTDASVSYRATALTGLLAVDGVEIVTDAERTRAMWAWARDAEMFAGTGRDVWRISVKPSDAVAVSEALPHASLFLDWGGGLVWAEVDSATDVRAALSAIPGHATLVRAAPETRARLGTFQPEAPGVTALSAGLRRKFDPRGILNPGLMA